MADGRQRVGRVAGSGTVDFDGARLQADDPLDRGPNHRHTVLSWGDGPQALLLPGRAGHDQEDDVEVEGVAHVDRGDEMTDMRRVERAPEQTDPLEHAGRVYSGDCHA